MLVEVGISNRHVHLKQEDFDKLFGKGSKLSLRNNLSQPGEFASNETVTIVGSKGKIENVRIIGPLRSYTQVEISKTDSFILGINPPVRMSGDLNGAETVIIKGPWGEIIANESTIISERHIHINKEQKSIFDLENVEKVAIKITGEKGGILKNVYLKEKDNYVLELHLDTDDANAFLLKNNDKVEIIKGE